MNGLTVHCYRQYLRPQPRTIAGGAWNFAKIISPLCPGPIAVGFKVPSLDIGKNTLKARGVAHFTTVLRAPLHLHLKVVAVENCVAGGLWQLLPGCIEVEFEICR